MSGSAHLWVRCTAEDLSLCLVALMASPKHVKSAHLRSLLSECLAMWLPEDMDDQGG